MNRQVSYIFPDSFLSRVDLLAKRMGVGDVEIIKQAVDAYDPQPVQHSSEPARAWVWNNLSKPIPVLTAGKAK